MKKILLLLYCCLYLFPALAQDVNPNGGDILQESTQPTDSDPPAIVNGQVVDITNAPWQVSFQRLIRGSSRIEQEGGGSILNPLWILTAAHVVINDPVSDWRVSAGSNNSFHTLNNVPVDGQLVQVAQIIIHPGYNSLTEENDLALVRLQTPLQFSNRVRPIQYATELNTPDNLMAPGAMVSLTGWGTTSYYSTQANPVLLGVNMPIISKVTANQIMQQQWQTQTLPRLVTDDMIAVYLAGSGKGVGYGDSGGPMVILNNGVPTLVGVCAWLTGYGPAPNTNPALGQSPSVYMRVKSYASWIQDNMAPESWCFRTKNKTASFSSVRLVSRNSSKVLEVAGATPNFDYNSGAAVQQGTKAGGQNSDNEPLNQEWSITNLNNGYFSIRAKSSNQALQIAGAAMNDGAVATQAPYTGASNQQWRIESVADGYYKIFARHSGKALEIGGFATANGAPASQYDYVGGSNQQWAIEDITPYNFLPNHNMTMALSATGTGTGAAVVQQSLGVRASNGYWQVVSVGGGAYKLISQAVDQVLEIGGGPAATNPGATANLWPYVSGANQKWQLERVGSYNDFAFIAQHSGLALEVGASSTADGASVHQWEYNGTLNQIWHGEDSGTTANRIAAPLAVAPQLSDVEDLSLFPNPASNQLRIMLPKATPVLSVIVTNMQGQHKKVAFYKTTGELDISGIAPGIYLITASDGAREYHQKFVKE